jgi:hypothetical protein
MSKIQLYVETSGTKVLEDVGNDNKLLLLLWNRLKCLIDVKFNLNR